MGPELVDIVDRKDRILKTIPRKEATNSDILRVVGVYILNKKESSFSNYGQRKAFDTLFTGIAPAAGMWGLEKTMKPLPRESYSKKQESKLFSYFLENTASN